MYTQNDGFSKRYLDFASFSDGSDDSESLPSSFPISPSRMMLLVARTSPF